MRRHPQATQLPSQGPQHPQKEIKTPGGLRQDSVQIESVGYPHSDLAPSRTCKQLGSPVGLPRGLTSWSPSACLWHLVPATNPVLTSSLAFPAGWSFARKVLILGFIIGEGPSPELSPELSPEPHGSWRMSDQWTPVQTCSSTMHFSKTGLKIIAILLPPLPKCPYTVSFFKSFSCGVMRPLDLQQLLKKCSETCWGQTRASPTPGAPKKDPGRKPGEHV